MKTNRSICSSIIPALFLGSPAGLVLLSVLFHSGVTPGLACLLAYTASTAGAVYLLRN